MLRATLVGLGLWVASTAAAETLVLANGDTITGTVVGSGEDHVLLDHPQLGLLRIGLDKIKIETAEAPRPGWFGANFLRGWNRRLDAGLTGQDGGSESTVVTGGLRLDYDDEWARWNIQGRTVYDRDEDGVSDHNARLDARRDWLRPHSPLFWSLGHRYQFDATESWEHRITFVGGPGYHLVDTDTHRLDVIVGPAFTREFGEVREDKAEGSLVLDYTWTLSEQSTLSLFNNTFLALAPDAGDARNLTRAEWATKIAARPELSLIVGAENEYLTEPEDDDESYNLKYYLSIGLDF